MKRVAFIAWLCIIFMIAFADVQIRYKSDSAPETIYTKSFSGMQYFNIYDLNKVFNALVEEDVLEQRININIYHKQLIFLINSSYLNFQGELYNFEREVICEGGKYYLPATVLEKLFPLILSEYVEYNEKKKCLEVAPPLDNSIKKIVIDPGHGGKDPGAVGYTGKQEKDVVLSVAEILKNQLLKEGFEVFLTRDTDEFVSLKSRTERANQVKADLFVSLHCNASKSREADGVEVYFLSTAKTNEARIVEALENSVVEKYEGEQALAKYDDLSYILMDMAQSEQLEESSNLALKIQANLVTISKASDRGVKQAGFYVLKGAYMPAILVEMGFISNKEEEKQLIDYNHQKNLAEAICQGIIAFKSRYEQM